METRVKYIKKNNSWYYAVQAKKWIFWKTLKLCSTWLDVDNFFIEMKKVDDFNSKSKTIRKAVYEGYGVREIFSSGRPSGSLGFFTTYPKKTEGKDGGVDWSGPHGDMFPLINIRLPKLFGKECLEPMKLRITIEQIEE